MPAPRAIRVRLLAVAVTAIAGVWALPASGVAKGCAGADTPATAASAAKTRAAILCLVNAQRHARHLPGLHESGQLDRSAQGWTNTMVRTGQFTHGADFAARISAVGFDWSDAGENIATGYPSPRAVLKGWMASQGHCENLLDPGFAWIGTGVSTHDLGQYGPATWTQDFGLRMGQRAPSGNRRPAAGCPYRI